MRAKGTHPIALMIHKPKEVTSREGGGEDKPTQSRKPTDAPDVSMSHAGGSSYESGQSRQAGQGDASDGDADADDEDEHLQRQMEEEDVDGNADNINFDDSEEEENSKEDSIPNSWNMDYIAAMVVNNGHDSAWEYHQNNVLPGVLYPDKQHLQ
jgi:hypothetical protein